MKVLDPIPTAGMEKEDAVELVKDVQRRIATQVAEWRGAPVEEVLGISS
jgi:hypothetical protein